MDSVVLSCYLVKVEKQIKFNHFFHVFKDANFFLLKKKKKVKIPRNNKNWIFKVAADIETTQFVAF